MNTDPETLAREIRNLSNRVRALELENRDLRARVELLEGGDPETSLTASTPATTSGPFAPPHRLGSSQAAASFGPATPSAPSLPKRSAELSDARREAAVSVGHFFERCLKGLPRGLSGRERVELASRVYVLVKDFEQKVYEPVQVYHRWGDIKPLVSRTGNQLGDSIFAGFPTLQEAQIAVAAAGLTWPRDA